MAILLEEENQSGVKRISLLAVLIIIVLLAVAAYYLFFASAPSVEVAVPPTLESISRISQVELNPSTITNSPLYTSLQQYVPKPEIGETGRDNPFRPF